MPKWDLIREEWENNNVTFKELAEKHGVKDSTIRSRKNREKWQRGNATKNATQRKNVATEKESVATPKKKASSTKKERYEPIVESDELTDKQRLFCIYYIKYFNATKAYQKAYECAYSTAMVNGHGLLRNTKVSAEIDRLKAEQTHELKLNVRDILQKYIDIAFADITDYVSFGFRSTTQKEVVGFDDEGNPITNEETDSYSYVDLNDSEEVDGTIVTEVKQGRDGISIKLADKMKALEMLSKYFDLLSDGDKKRLQEEKLRMDIEKTRAEVEKLTSKETTAEITFVDDIGDEDET